MDTPTPPNLPHLDLSNLQQESLLLDDHGDHIIGDRRKPPQARPQLGPNHQKDPYSSVGLKT